MTAPTRPGPLTAAQKEPIDMASVHVTVEQVLNLEPAPHRQRLVELEGLLRDHIEVLLPIAETAVDELERGAVEWSDHRHRLSCVRETLRHGLGDGALSALVQVTALTRDCLALLAYVEGRG